MTIQTFDLWCLPVLNVHGHAQMCSATSALFFNPFEFSTAFYIMAALILEPFRTDDLNFHRVKAGLRRYETVTAHESTYSDLDSYARTDRSHPYFSEPCH